MIVGYVSVSEVLTFEETDKLELIKYSIMVVMKMKRLKVLTESENY